MRKRVFAGLLAIALLAAVMGTTGCTRVPLEDVEGPSGVVVKKLSAPLGGAEQLDARFEVPAGEFSLRGGSSSAMDAEIRHSRDWVPRMEYSVEATTGVLRVDQETVATFKPFRQETNEWDVKLANGVPIDLDVKLGAGESTLDLSGLDVRTLKALTGVGETTIDLSGERANSLDARIEAGVGELTVRVPQDIGVRLVKISEGIGEFSAEGLTERDGEWVNDAYATSDVKIEITLHGGIGEIEVISVP